MIHILSFGARHHGDGITSVVFIKSARSSMSNHSVHGIVVPIAASKLFKLAAAAQESKQCPDQFTHTMMARWFVESPTS